MRRETSERRGTGGTGETGKSSCRAFLASLACLASLAASCEPVFAATFEVLSWEVQPNSLVEVVIDEDGDGKPDRVELHVVARYAVTMLSETALSLQAAKDDLWVFVVEGDVGRLVYFVVMAPLVVCEAGRCERS